jgi:hypothetical protein
VPADPRPFPAYLDDYEDRGVITDDPAAAPPLSGESLAKIAYLLGRHYRAAAKAKGPPGTPTGRPR